MRPSLESKILGCAVTVLAIAAMPAMANADTIDATVTTLMSGRQDWRDGRLYTVVPVYQSLNLMADLTVPGKVLDEVKVTLSGWGGVDAANAKDTGVLGDLDVASIKGVLFKGRVTLQMGRQIIYGGAARVTQFDGGALTLMLVRGLGLTAYGGAPVTPRFGTSRGDVVGGGRLFYRYSYGTEIGASFIEVLGAGRTARQDVALDARYAPLSTLTLTAYGLYSLREVRFAEAQVTANWQPRPIVQVSVDYRRTSPDLFLPLNSILSVFSQESHDEVGGALWARPHQRLRLDADYHLIVDTNTELGHRGGVKLSALLGTTTLGLEGRILHLTTNGATNGYYRARLFGMQRLAEVFVSVDADAFLLEQQVNGHTASFTASGTVGWDFKPGWRAVLTGIADVTPFYTQNFEVIARLAYNHTFRFHEVK